MSSQNTSNIVFRSVIDVEVEVFQHVELVAAVLEPVAPPLPPALMASASATPKKSSMNILHYFRPVDAEVHRENVSVGFVYQKRKDREKQAKAIENRTQTIREREERQRVRLAARDGALERDIRQGLIDLTSDVEIIPVRQ
jgi:hypothetical protein